MEFKIIDLETKPGAEMASNFPKYRRVYLWLLIGAPINYLIHFVGIPVLPVETIVNAWACEFELCDHFQLSGFYGKSEAFLSLIITLRIQLILCVALIVFLSVRRLINLLVRAGRVAVEDWRLYLSGVFMTIICTCYVGIDTYSLLLFAKKTGMADTVFCILHDCSNNDLAPDGGTGWSFHGEIGRIRTTESEI
ncbi:hypothetical protein [Defluviimonas salinarum]|uniref:Uncharacterized protein n=1 Tax=Defluviimonas salinarum TaxID=2992147 RepID=A0ABT3J1E5_9RHOB|nr:hypothetical protein [Defluviimonas salinarum]MCW3781270.1 hypothetical protein [Defluviimonas salinarum]